MQYKITITTSTGHRHTITTETPNICGLLQAVEKCEIKQFSISLPPQK